MSNYFSLAFLLILSVLISVTNAAVWLDLHAKKTICDDDNNCEDFCHIENQLLKPGESIKTKECSQIFCTNEYTARGITCGVAEKDGCRLEPDYTLEYPDCCYKICNKKS